MAQRRAGLGVKRSVIKFSEIKHEKAYIDFLKQELAIGLEFAGIYKALPKVYDVRKLDADECIEYEIFLPFECGDKEMKAIREQCLEPLLRSKYVSGYRVEAGRLFFSAPEGIIVYE